MMAKGKLIQKDKDGHLILILREAQQHGEWIDPVDNKEHKIEFTIVIGGGNSGCPIVEIDGHKVTWDFTDLLDEAVQILREAGHLPKEEIGE